MPSFTFIGCARIEAGLFASTSGPGLATPRYTYDQTMEEGFVK